MTSKPTRIAIGAFIVLMLFATVRGRECEDCHKETVDLASRQPYLHPPFAEGNCGSCHFYPPKLRPSDAGQSIWISTPVGTIHMATFPFKKGGRWRGWIRVIREGVMEERPLEIKAKDLPLLEDRKPPRLSPPRVGKVRRGVFWQAEILWDTDEPATSQVEYSLDAKSWATTPRDEGYCTEHRVMLSDLEKGMLYHIRARSVDPWGNEGVSEETTFRVEAETHEGDRQRTAPSSSTGPLRIQDVRIGRTPRGLVIISWRCPVPAEGTLELVELPEEDALRAREANNGHEGLIFKGDRERGFESCYRCHPPHTLGASHPVGVRIPPDMKVRGGLPTADGMILCISCHNPHGSRYPYLLRLSNERELCISCHGDRY